MRTTKVMAFSVPSALTESIILVKSAEAGALNRQRNFSVRRFAICLKLQEFETTRLAVSKRMKKMGVKSADVDVVLRGIRKQA